MPAPDASGQEGTDRSKMQPHQNRAQGNVRRRAEAPAAPSPAKDRKAGKAIETEPLDGGRPTFSPLGGRTSSGGPPDASSIHPTRPRDDAARGFRAESVRAEPEIHPATMKQVSPMPCDFLFCEQDDHLLGQRTVDHSPLCQLCLSRDEKAAACPPCPATNTAPLTGDAAISREKAYFPTIACYAGPLPRKQWIHSLWFGIGGRVLRFRRPRALVRSSRQTALRPAPYCFSLIARLEQREFPPIPMPAVLRPYNPPCSGFVRGCVAK